MRIPEYSGANESVGIRTLAATDRGRVFHIAEGVNLREGRLIHGLLGTK